jgi:YD repeat-containing protein
MFSAGSISGHWCRWLLLISWLSGVLPCQGQSAQQLGAEYLPKTPTVSAFARYDEQHQVNQMTGAAQLSLPLVALSSGSLHVPVSLNYTYSGLQVFQAKDFVGLGWSLQAGGSITLQINGAYDGAPSYYGGYNQDTLGRYMAGQSYRAQLFLRAVAEGHADAEPDFYHFQMGPYSGRFLLQDGQVRVFSNDNIRVSMTDTARFQLTTEQGVQYIFAALERTIPAAVNFATIPAHISTWHLSSIISANRRDTIRLHYASHPIGAATNGYYRDVQHVSLTTGQHFVGDPSWRQSCAQDGSYHFENVTQYPSRIKLQFLDSISSRTERVVFRRNGQQELQQVQLLSLVGKRQQVRRFDLRQSYFDATNAQPRLRLERVQELNGAQQLPAYVFTYAEDDGFPQVYSLGLDHWGYYNGATSNTMLLPQTGYGNQAANRTPRFSKARLGALTTVQYPTGGTTSFEYEPNTYHCAPHQAKTFTQVTDGLTYNAATSRQVHPAGGPAAGALIPVSALTLPFTLTQRDSIYLYLHRDLTAGELSSADPSTPGPRSGNFNRYDDVQLYRVRSERDSLVQAFRMPAGATDAVRGYWLPPGTYQVVMFCEEPEPYVSALVNVPHYTFTREKVGPGIRVKRLTTRSAAQMPPLERTYAYTLVDERGAYSSGELLLPLDQYGEPSYQVRPFQLFQQDQRGECMPGNGDVTGNGCPPVYCDFQHYTSSIERFDQQAYKYKWFYQRVTEQLLEKEQTQGQTVSYFQAYPEAFSEVLLTRQQQLARRTDHTLQVRQETRTTYTPVPTASFFTIRPYQVSQRASNIAYGAADPEKTYAVEINVFYNASLPLTQQTSVQYGLAGDSVRTVTYSTYYQKRLVRQRTLLNGSSQVVRYKYAAEYSPALSWAAGLQAKFANPVVETQTWRHRFAPVGGVVDSVLVGGRIQQFDADLCAPVATFELALTQPSTQPDQEAQPSRQGRYAHLLSDSRYQPTVLTRYEPHYGSPVQVVPAQTPRLGVSLLWAARGTIPLAQAQQALPSHVAYTSFEADATGRWRYDSTGTHRVLGGRTGRYAYQLDGTVPVTRGELPAGEYELTYWVQGAVPTLSVQGGRVLGGSPQPVASTPNNWTHYRSRVQLTTRGQIQVGGTASKLDEVRLYPVGAQLTTYTHDPSVGTTSQTGPDGRTVFYEYDGLGRLLRARDEQGRILSQQQYHYAGK